MALIRRVSRLFAADMHAVLDQIEEPGIVIRQAIREMEEQFAREQQREKWLIGEIDAIAKRVAGFEATTAELDTQLDLCLASGNDGLARRLVRRKLETAQLARQAIGVKESLAGRLSDLREQIERHRDQLEGMRQKASVLELDDGSTADIGGRASHIDEDDVELALMREKQARASA